jgi:hypothetical protein
LIISTTNNLELISDNFNLTTTGKLTILNNTIGGQANPLLVLQNNNTASGASVFETYKNDAPTSTGGDIIGTWSATCNTNIGKTEISRINQLAFGKGAENNDGGIGLACKVNGAFSNFLLCNGGVGSGEIKIGKPITTTPQNPNLDIKGPASINIEAAGNDLILSAGQKIIFSTNSLNFNGAGLQSNTASGNSWIYLRINLNGVFYKVLLEND